MKDIFNDNFSPARAEISIIPMEPSGDQSFDVSADSLPETLPILALRNVVLFPGTTFPVSIGREKSLKLIHDADKKGFFIGAVPQTNQEAEDPALEDLYEYGTLAKVVKIIELPDGTTTAILTAYGRVHLDSITSEEPYLTGKVQYVPDYKAGGNKSRLKIAADQIKEKAVFILSSNSYVPKEALSAIKSINNFDYLVNFIAESIELENFIGKIELLGIASIEERGERLLQLLVEQCQIVELKNEINMKVKGEMDQQQREYFLNSQLRTIQEELGMDDEEDIAKLREKAAQAGWSDEVQAIFEKELLKLERQNPSSPDYSTQLNYLQFLTDLPWNRYSEDNLDLKHAMKVLNDDHYGLDSVKDRIIEYLATLKLKGNMKSPILCLYGPPGVGKTSLGKSIANALGRKYVRISLGGMHDESEIRGHRKTYIGALPGRILNGIMRAGTSNPVIVLDEVDKVSTDFRGDPSSALLEALDPEQNSTFRDNYLNLPFDLSKVFFILTANTLDTIPRPLLDRAEIIELSGYIDQEKIEIARKYLLPKNLVKNGFKKNQVKYSKQAFA